MNQLVLVVLTLVGLVLSDETSDLKERFEQVHVSCAVRTLFRPSGIKNLIDLDFAAAQQVPNHDCFEKCVVQTIGTVTPTGLDGDKILEIVKIFQPQTIEQTKIQIAKCSSLYDPNNFDCAAAWRLYLCLQNAESTLNGSSAATYLLVGALWN